MGVKFFGQYLLEKGKITADQLIKALDYQKSINVPIGTVALDEGFLTAEQIKKIHDEQYRTDKKFGEIAVDFGLLTNSQVEEILEKQMSRKVYLGEALVKKGFISVEELEKELKKYKEEQEKEEVGLKDVLLQIRHKDLIEAFVDITVKMFLRLVREIVKVKGYHTLVEKVNLFDWTISQELKGEFNAKFLLNITDSLLLKIATSLTKKSVDKIDEITLDAAREFVNIITGNALSKLSTQGLNLRANPPVSFNNNSDKKYTIPSNKEVASVPLLSTAGELEMILEF